VRKYNQLEKWPFTFLCDIFHNIDQIGLITGMDPHWGFGGVATPPKILGNFRKFWEILNFLER
jgi:hypothetical protein